MLNPIQVGIVGDAGVGKTTYCHAVTFAWFVEKYKSTKYYKSFDVKVNFTSCMLDFRVWDIPSTLYDEDFKQVIENMDHIIIMHDFNKGANLTWYDKISKYNKPHLNIYNKDDNGGFSCLRRRYMYEPLLKIARTIMENSYLQLNEVPNYNQVMC